MTLHRRTLLLTLAAAAIAAPALPALPALAAQLAVDEGGFVNINGVEQWIGLRGYDANKPVMLFLHGGPGLGITHGSPVFDAWEREFTIAYWDMPYGGATHAHNLSKDQGPLTIDRYVNDALAVAGHLRKRRGVDKIVLFGISFGTRIGIEMAARRPEWFSAYVGTAQVASGSKGGRLGYDLGLEAARKRGDAAGVAALEKAGPPPYQTLDQFLVRQTYTNPPGFPASAREVAATAALIKLSAEAPPQPNAKSIPRNLPTYDFLGNFMKVQDALFRETWAWEARDLGRTFKIPVYVFQGSDDLNTPTATAREWFDWIAAPRKAFAVIEGASHNTMAFHAELFALMQAHVLPAVKA